MVATLQGISYAMLRFGGNSAYRRFFWTSTGEALPCSYLGTKTLPARARGPDDLKRINDLLEKYRCPHQLVGNLGDYAPRAGGGPGQAWRADLWEMSGGRHHRQ
ncbi:hypothetical protein BJ956_002583 [Arthrobacter psychrochitiniphilus]|nr:hypothetical protein [Arthrobacter psychrochitiniphilus]